MAHPALAGLRTPLVEEGLPDLGHVSSEINTAPRSPGLLPGCWPDAVRQLRPLWFCYLDLQPCSRKGSLQGTPPSCGGAPGRPEAEPGVGAVGASARVRLGGVSRGQAARRGSGECAPLVAHGLFFPAAALEVRIPCCPPQ